MGLKLVNWRKYDSKCLILVHCSVVKLRAFSCLLSCRERRSSFQEPKYASADVHIFWQKYYSFFPKEGKTNPELCQFVFHLSFMYNTFTWKLCFKFAQVICNKSKLSWEQALLILCYLPRWNVAKNTAKIAVVRAIYSLC